MHRTRRQSNGQTYQQENETLRADGTKHLFRAHCLEELCWFAVTVFNALPGVNEQPLIHMITKRARELGWTEDQVGSLPQHIFEEADRDGSGEPT